MRLSLFSTFPHIHASHTLGMQDKPHSRDPPFPPLPTEGAEVTVTHLELDA